MSRLAELLVELCPDGVEYKRLNDTCIIKRGIRVVRNQLKFEGTIPVYQNSLTPMGYHDKSNCSAGTAFIIVAGAAGDVGYSPIPFWAADDCFYFDCPESLLGRFLYYVLSSKQMYLYSKVRKASIPRLARNHIEDLKIPVPPLPVQAEIVRILDNFTELTAELTAELEARKKQYEFYRDKLLNFDVHGGGAVVYEQMTLEGIPYKEVQELFEFKNGLNKGKEFFGSGTPIVNFTDVFKNRWLTADMLKGRVTVDHHEIERYSAQNGDLFFTRTSETQEEIGMSSVLLDDVENCVFSGFVLRARPKTDLLLPKFSSYFFSSSMARKQIVRTSTFTTRALTSASKLARIRVPIPPLDVQQRIVTILDHFDTLCNDLTSGLPAEIEARKKQYEYYRDKLLSFKEKKA